jgi:2-C-methyl-D-erythritol 4-phosphate cytidylyltransferase/2-C-methyl-D-erythritol 2,4-cyclodiphosphate synthase
MATLVLLAGGTGSRAGVPKQHIKLINGKTPCEMLLDSYAEFGLETIFVYNEECLEDAEKLSEKYDIILVEGGNTRQESICNALSSVKEGSVLIHDAARPLVKQETIKSVLENAGQYDIVQPVLYSQTTMIYRGKTVSRGDVAEPQCPVCFERKDLKDCYELAIKHGDCYPDSLTMIKEYDLLASTCYVDGHQCGFKITYPEDIDLLNAYIARDK